MCVSRAFIVCLSLCTSLALAACGESDSSDNSPNKSGEGGGATEEGALSVQDSLAPITSEVASAALEIADEGYGTHEKISVCSTENPDLDDMWEGYCVKEVPCKLASRQAEATITGIRGWKVDGDNPDGRGMLWQIVCDGSGGDYPNDEHYYSQLRFRTSLTVGESYIEVSTQPGAPSFIDNIDAEADLSVLCENMDVIEEEAVKQFLEQRCEGSSYSLNISYTRIESKSILVGRNHITGDLELDWSEDSDKGVFDRIFFSEEDFSLTDRSIQTSHRIRFIEGAATTCVENYTIKLELPGSDLEREAPDNSEVEITHPCEDCEKDMDCANNHMCNEMSECELGCNGDEDCRPSLSCDPDLLQCLTMEDPIYDGCEFSDDCADNEVRKECETESGLCVQCLAPKDCEGNETCVFNACVPSGTGCETSENCGGNAMRKLCDVEADEPSCVECRTDGDCSGGQVCQTMSISLGDGDVESKYCTCSEESQCSDDPKGSKCFSNTTGICGCTSAFQHCEGEQVCAIICVSSE